MGERETQQTVSGRLYPEPRLRSGKSIAQAGDAARVEKKESAEADMKPRRNPVSRLWIALGHKLLALYYLAVLLLIAVFWEDTDPYR